MNCRLSFDITCHYVSNYTYSLHGQVVEYMYMYLTCVMYTRYFIQCGSLLLSRSACQHSAITQVPLMNAWVVSSSSSGAGFIPNHT